MHGIQVKLLLQLNMFYDDHEKHKEVYPKSTVEMIYW